VYAAGVDDVIGELVGQQGKVGAGMQRGVVACGKRVDGDVDVTMVSGGQLASVGKLCEATLAGNGDDVVQVQGMADAVCEYRAVDITLQMPVWCENGSGMRGLLSAVGKVPLAECDVDKGACVVRGQGVERYIPSLAERHGDGHNKMQLVCVSSGGVPVPYLSAGDAGLECLGDIGCVGECVGCGVVGPGVIEMVYRVEGTGDVKLIIRLFGEAVLVSVIVGLCCREREVCSSFLLCIYVLVRVCVIGHLCMCFHVCANVFLRECVLICVGTGLYF